MTPARALEILGLQPGATAAEVRAAFAACVKATHPDTRKKLVEDEIYPEIVELMDARGTLLTAIEDANNACKACNGVGKVRVVVGWRRCGACGGRG